MLRQANIAPRLWQQYKNYECTSPDRPSGVKPFMTDVTVSFSVQLLQLNSTKIRQKQSHRQTRGYLRLVQAQSPVLFFACSCIASVMTIIQGRLLLNEYIRSTVHRIERLRLHSSALWSVALRSFFSSSVVVSVVSSSFYTYTLVVPRSF